METKQIALRKTSCERLLMLELFQPKSCWWKNLVSQSTRVFFINHVGTLRWRESDTFQKLIADMGMPEAKRRRYLWDAFHEQHVACSPTIVMSQRIPGIRMKYSLVISSYFCLPSNWFQNATRGCMIGLFGVKHLNLMWNISWSPPDRFVANWLALPCRFIWQWLHKNISVLGSSLQTVGNLFAYMLPPL